MSSNMLPGKSKVRIAAAMLRAADRGF